MNDKFNEWFKSVDGKPIEVEDPSNIYMCFDLAFSWCDFIGIPRSAIRHLNAYQIWTEPNDETIKYFDFIPNTSNGLPKTGDIVIFSTLVGPAGHVCIATGEGDSSYFKSADQNWNGVQKVVIVTHHYEGISGWLRPKNEVITQPIAQVIDDKYKYDFGGDIGILELGAVRSIIKDTKSANSQQAVLIEDLRKQLIDAKIKPVEALNPSSTSQSGKTGIDIITTLIQWFMAFFKAKK